MSVRRGFSWSTLPWPVRRSGLALAIGIVALMLVSLGRVAIDNYRIGQQKSALQTQIAALRQENQSLQDRVTYLQSSSAIEELAREELGWTRPGDTAVVVVSRRSVQPPVAVRILLHRRGGSGNVWQKWWGWLVDRIGH